jgi:hypothetical protein
VILDFYIYNPILNAYATALHEIDIGGVTDDMVPLPIQKPPFLKMREQNYQIDKLN